jgi:hypothetical protein
MAVVCGEPMLPVIATASLSQGRRAPRATRFSRAWPA